jgi:hypothetical protein
MTANDGPEATHPSGFVKDRHAVEGPGRQISPRPCHGPQALGVRGPRVQSERQRAFLIKRYETLVDPDGVLDEAERAKRASRLRRSHLAEMTRRSIVARKKTVQP